jgi:hypothetical protein
MASITPAALGVCQLAVGSELGTLFFDWECDWWAGRLSPLSALEMWVAL